MTIPITAYPTIIEKYSSYFSKYFNIAAFEHFKTYLTGLITGGKTTVTAISRRAISGKNQSSLNRFLTQSPWGRKVVSNGRIKTGYGIIDDTLTHKTGKKMKAIGKYFDHADHRYMPGHNLVNSLYADKRKCWPTDHRLYLKEEHCKEHHLTFKSKNILACELIDSAYKRGLNIRTWLFDSWYMNKLVVDRVESHQADWVAGIKINRKILRPEGSIRLIQYLREQVPKEAYKKVNLGGKIRHYFTKTVIVKSLGGRRVRILAFFNNYEAYSCRWCLVELAYTLLMISQVNCTILEKVSNQISTLGKAAEKTSQETLKAFVCWIHKQLRSS